MSHKHSGLSDRMYSGFLGAVSTAASWPINWSLSTLTVKSTDKAGDAGSLVDSIFL